MYLSYTYMFIVLYGVMAREHLNIQHHPMKIKFSAFKIESKNSRFSFSPFLKIKKKIKHFAFFNENMYNENDFIIFNFNMLEYEG